MKPFDIFIAYISWGEDGKNRPVLAIVLDDESIDVYQITTKYESKSEAIRALHFKIDEWKQAGLDEQSYIDTGTLISLSTAAFNKKTPIGKLSEHDKRRLLDFLTTYI